MTARVAINGYGTVGKRLADAVAAQDDMEVVGVTKTRPTFEVHTALARGYRLYAAAREHLAAFEEADMPVDGTLGDLLGEADIVLDGTPQGSGYKAAYDKAGVKAVWQGGESHALTGLSFNAYANYEAARGVDRLRVPSCNTTGLIRTLYPLLSRFAVENVNAVMIRRAADPWDTKRGPINAIVPELRVPSHHGPDVQTVLKDLNIQTLAVKVPTTMMHLHAVTADLDAPIQPEDVLDVWKETPRIRFVQGADGITSTAQIMELARDLRRPRGDLFEIAVWEDGVHVRDRTLYYYQAVHQEADVVPENVDAIRAMTGLEREKEESIRKTDLSLGIPTVF
ncbi:MAG: type II glyceraldehyde-3-phosphate dehydrogenase [Thermoplasmata archaeon]